MLEASYALKNWTSIKSIHQLIRKHCDKRTGKETTAVSYYISSLEDSGRILRSEILANLYHAISVCAASGSRVKERRWCGVMPKRRIASRWAGVG